MTSQLFIVKLSRSFHLLVKRIPRGLPCGVYEKVFMSEKKIRTRFPPSPTGYLHLGGARTALFCWLFARHHQGTFVFRIEDTDRERSTPEAIDVILRGMEWLGLDYDEGPFYQTQRFDRYHEVIQQLLASGKAYRCYCTKERLDQLREKQRTHKQKPRYDGYCRDLDRHDNSTPHVIRFRNPQEGEVVFEDKVLGKISVSNQELDDLIIARSDGMPTYNFTVVVDDWDMQITDVIRGMDHINNTPRQMNILKALNADIPNYAHVPMILGNDGKKLSKRHGAVSVLQYRDDGFLPAAMNNYLARLGWSHGDQEIFSGEELIQYFDLDQVSRSPAAFNLEKLVWLNQHYMKTLDPTMVAKPLADQMQMHGIDYETGPRLESLIELQAERTKTLNEMAERSRYFYEDTIKYDEKAARKHLKPAILPGLTAVREKIAVLNEWSKENLHQIIIDVSESLALKLGKLAQPIRVAMTGVTISPPMDITLEYIGRERVLARLDQAIQYIQGNE